MHYVRISRRIRISSKCLMKFIQILLKKCWHLKFQDIAHKNTCTCTCQNRVYENKQKLTRILAICIHFFHIIKSPCLNHTFHSVESERIINNSAGVSGTFETSMDMADRQTRAIAHDMEYAIARGTSNVCGCDIWMFMWIRFYIFIYNNHADTPVC